MSEPATSVADEKYPGVLQLTREVALPRHIAAHRMAFLGTTNSGKSYMASRCAELMWEAAIQFVAIDPVGIWWAMRLRADKVNPGFPITVFGGKHGDLPIRSTDGALVAETIHHERISAVVDTSGFESDAETRRFVHAFVDRLYRLRVDQPGMFHLFLEEAHEFVPQDPQTGDNQMLHVLNRWWKQGGNFGLGGSLISQRPQDLNTKARGLSGVVFALNTVGSHEYDALAKWLKGVPEVSLLPGLQPGEALCYSPSLLQVKQIVHGTLKVTHHARFDPTKPPEVIDDRSIAVIDVDALRVKFTEAAQEVENTDPKKLRDRIKDLESRLKESASNQGLSSEVEQRERLESENMRLIATLDQAQADLAVYKRFGDAVVGHIDGLGKLAVEFGQEKGILNSDGKAFEGPESLPVISPPRRSVDASDGLSTSQQSILNTLATLAVQGIENPQKEHVALFAGASPKSSGYANNLGRLRTLGLIDYPSGGRVTLTTDGQSRATSERVLTLAELHQKWNALLSGSQATILRALIVIYPRAVNKEVLANSVGASPKSSGYSNNLGRLRSLGLITYPAPNMAAATPLLFPEGLR